MDKTGKVSSREREGQGAKGLSSEWARERKFQGIDQGPTG